MRKKDEALKLALEAFEYVLKPTKEFDDDVCQQLHDKAITVIREALAEQPAQQEPVAVRQFRKRGCSDWYDGHPDHTDGGGPYEARTLYTSPPAQQEPVAWMGAHDRTDLYYRKPPQADVVPLYTSPPASKPWVGLTDEERNSLWRHVVGWGDPSHDDEDLMKAIEAKLKEKNT